MTRRSPGSEEFDRSDHLDVRRAGRSGGGPRSNLLVNARGLLEAARFRPRAVLSAHIVTSPAARAIGRMAGGIPVIQYLHADELRTRPRTASFAVGADALVAVSRHTEELALAAGAAPERIRRIPNGVDIPDRRPAERARRPTVVTVARLEQRYKGHDVLLRALPLVRERVPDVEWVVVGAGSLRPELERLAAAQDLGKTVSFLGAVSDEERDAVLDRAHVFAMPSRLPPGGVGGEGFGIAYLEAAAHGLPSVAGNVGGAPDAVVDGETGLLVDPEDHRAVAAALVEILIDPGRAAALGGAAARRARQFAWPGVARRLEDLIFELAAYEG